ncbi:CBS domain-containing protein [Streptomyces odontomachi]|uniref:CBS domain-containing protein n=1 Tax=Streptomyces odontomachi TaxID=2944940 RepID=UPI00210C3365|nr:CBS domain-containing protein [Streptomyces sp. ODS25]
MRQRSVSDLMTRGVVDVGPDTGFKEIVKTLADHDITAVPVVDDDGHPLGVVSEADLMRFEARRPDPSGRVPEVLQRYAPPTDDTGPAAGRSPRAGNLMTSPALVAYPEWSVVEAARLMDEGHVKRLPVVDRADHLVGMLSRADLLRAFLRQDSAIHEEITTDILTDTFHMAPSDVDVNVVDGDVTLRGTVQRRSTVPVLVRLCRSVDGVVSVLSELTARTDDDTVPDDAAQARRREA